MYGNDLTVLVPKGEANRLASAQRGSRPCRQQKQRIRDEAARDVCNVTGAASDAVPNIGAGRIRDLSVNGIPVNGGRVGILQQRMHARRIHPIAKDDVAASPAIQAVVASTARQSVVARVPQHQIIARIARHDIIV